MNQSISSTTQALYQAIEQSPSLAKLLHLAQLSQRCWQSVAGVVVPEYLCSAIKPSSLQDGVWCLLVSNQATASKLKLLIPRIIHHLHQQDVAIQQIRIKVQRRE